MRGDRMAKQRTQIYLEPAQHRALEREARRRGSSISELIREAIDRWLDRRAQAGWEDDPITALVGKIPLGLADAAERHDYYLYGMDDEAHG